MNLPLLAAAVLVALVGIAHSYLGERYILGRLFRRGNLPELFRRADFTKRTLRLAWHVLTALAFGFAALFVVLASSDGEEVRTLVRILAVTFAASSFLSLVLVRGRHLSWVAFLAIAVLAWTAQR